MGIIGSSPTLTSICLTPGSDLTSFPIKLSILARFGAIILSNKFDGEQGIEKNRDNQNINVYSDVLNGFYNFHEYELTISFLDTQISPFLEFSQDNIPDWFSIYSKEKHNKIKLIEAWNLKHSLHALGGLLVLVVNHPSVEGMTFKTHSISNKVFQEPPLPRFAKSITSVSF